jgi:hypothetical protein
MTEGKVSNEVEIKIMAMTAWRRVGSLGSKTWRGKQVDMFILAFSTWVNTSTRNTLSFNGNVDNNSADLMESVKIPSEFCTVRIFRKFKLTQPI